MFWAVKCWDEEKLLPENIRKVASELKVPPVIIEREIIFYDTLKALSKSTPTPLLLKGGTLVSRLYSEYPRFSWDIDLSSFLTNKRDYDIVALNSMLEKLGNVKEVKIGNYSIRLGLIEKDVEKDVFADILPIKRDISTISLGTHLPIYLRKVSIPVEKLSAHLLKLRKELGRLPFIESTRGTIYFGEIENKSIFKQLRIPSLIEKAMRPKTYVKMLCYPIEYCIIEKISRLAKPSEEVSIRDVLCDFYDLGQLTKKKIQKGFLLNRYKTLFATRKIPDISMLKKRLKTNFMLIKANLGLFEKRMEFALAQKYDWTDYYQLTIENINALLSALES